MGIDFISCVCYTKGMNYIDEIIAYEAGELDEEDTVELFQKLVDSGLAFELQGHYGRVAMQYIQNGLVTTNPY